MSHPHRHSRRGVLAQTFGAAWKAASLLERLQQNVTPQSLKTLQGGYGDYLINETKQHDFRVQLNTPAEVMARGVRDNLAAVFSNYDRA